MVFISESFLRIEIDLFMGILLSIITIHSILQSNLKLLRYKLFTVTSVLCLSALFIEIITSYSRQFSIINSAFAVRLLNISLFIMSPFIPLFIYFFIKESTTGKFNRKKALIASLPAIFNVIISILNYSSDILFIISDSTIYSRGPLFFITPLVNIFYYILIIVYVLRNSYYLEKEEIFVFINAVLLPFLLGSVQVLNSLYLTICASYSVSMVILYVFLLNDNAKRDPLTGLGNKAKYYDCINILKKKRCKTLKVISFDLDNFKGINDTYGHEQGDIAIQSFASMIYSTFKEKSKIIRFGGDEFIIFTFNDKIYSLLKLLALKMDRFNSSNIVPFELNFSYGIADQCNTENFNLTIEELIKKSDDTLYINKKLKKSSK